jgi:hypothetical protein
MPAHAAERASLAASALSHAEAAGATAWSMMARQDRLTALLEMGAIEDFEAELSAYAAVAESVRRPHDLWRSALMHATVALFRGHMEAGTRLAQDAFSTGARLQQPGALQSFAVQMFFIGWQRNRLAGLFPEAESAANANDAVPAFRAALAVACAGIGRHEDAQREIGRVAHDDFLDVPEDNLWLATLTLLAHASWLSLDATFAASLEQRIAPYEACNVKIGSALALGAASLPLGLAQAAQGRLDLAASSLERAIVANTKMGSSLWTATARRHLAEVLRLRGHAGDTSRATEQDSLAVAVGAILDAERLVDNHPWRIA